MFFKFRKGTATPSACEVAQKAMDVQRDEIVRRMALLDQVNVDLIEAVRQTQESSVKLTDKVNREFKIAKKSLTTISSKLNEGMVLLNHEGHIVHLNKSAAKLLGVTEHDMLGKFLDDVVACASPVYSADGTLIQKPILMHHFFKNLSNEIFEKLKTNPTEEKYLVCNKSLKDAIPFCIEADADAILCVRIIVGSKTLPLKVTLTVLDNDPESLQDVTYVFLFSEHK